MKYKNLVTSLSKKFNLSGGNCGTFACALALSTVEKDPEIVVITNEEEENNLFYGEPDIYHVMTKINNLYYDAEGIHSNLESTIDWIDEEYSSPEILNSHTFPKEEWNTPKFFTMIRSNTNYSTEIMDFSYAIKKYSTKRKTQ